jgi:hypothetical protein
MEAIATRHVSESPREVEAMREWEKAKKEAIYWQQQAREHEEISNYERNLIKHVKTLDENLYRNAVNEYNNTIVASSSSTSIPTMDVVRQLK